MYSIIQNKIQESFGSSKDMKKRLDLVVEEADELWQFNQRFIDEHAIDRERMMLATDLPIVRKMEILEWFSRYSEFLSPNHAFQCIISFKDQFVRGVQKEEYISLEHENDSVIMMIDLAERSAIEVKNSKDKKVQAKLEARLSVRLNLLEPMIVNFQNLDMAINRNLVDLLMDLCRTQEIIEDRPDQPIRVYLKYCLRLLALCLRTQKGLDIFLDSKITFNHVLDMVSGIDDEEIVGNAAKILKMLMNEPEKVILTYKSYNLCKLMMYAISKYVDKSDAIVVELLGGVERYTSNPDFIQDFPKELIDTLLLLAKKNWKNNPAKLIIRNLARDPEYEALLRQQNYIDSESESDN